MIDCETISTNCLSPLLRRNYAISSVYFSEKTCLFKLAEWLVWRLYKDNLESDTFYMEIL